MVSEFKFFHVSAVLIVLKRSLIDWEFIGSIIQSTNSEKPAEKVKE